MASIQDFAKKAKNLQRLKSNKCVVYTRVSSKDQADNNGSLATQMKYCMEFVERNKFELVECFGGTYESAKSDDNRKEFQRMLAHVNKQKDISTIVVYSLDRFSRTGGQATSIIESLREKGIEVRAVQQDFNTDGPSGKMMQDILMVIAKADNEMRRDKSVTGMREKLLQGYWICHVPKGYTNENEHSAADKQKIVINKDGRLIKKAFKMRIQGYSYQAIHEKLSPLGFEVSPKNIGQVLSNPFYAGIISHNLLQGELVRGKHPALVTEDEFLEANAKSTHPKAENMRSNSRHEDLPLKTFMRVEESGMPFTGYIAKKGNIAYYKNRNLGKAVNINAAKANATFKNMLKELQIDKRIVPDIEKRVMRQLKEKLADFIEAEKSNERSLEDLKNNMRSLTQKFVEGQIDASTYQVIKEKYKADISAKEAHVLNAPLKSSNLEKVVKKGMVICANAASIWESGDFEQKRIFQNMLFPEGIFLSKEKKTVRTDRINEIIFRISEQAKDRVENKKRENEYSFIFPCRVARSRIELPTSGL